MIRCGRATRPAISVTARASVGETTAPSVNAAGHERPSQPWATTATPVIVAPTSPNASSEIGRRFERRSRSEVKNAAE